MAATDLLTGQEHAAAALAALLPQAQRLEESSEEAVQRILEVQ